MTHHVEKREAELKRAFTKELKLQLPGFLILAYATAGAPDREIVGNGITSRWECKNATPQFRSPGNQELTCMRLAAVAHCRYVFWWERGTTKKTMIVHPRHVHHRDGWDVIPEAWCVGFDIRWLVDQVRMVHML